MPSVEGFVLTSDAFRDGQPIPRKHAYKGEGENVSPPLAWSGAPPGTKSFALICDDPDAPSREAPRKEGPWVHWVVYNIPADATSLPAGASGRPAEGSAQAGAAKGWAEGTTDFGGEPVYGGPMPPPGSGTHRYFFKLYALDATLSLKSGAAKTKKELLGAMQEHILAETKLMGTYERK